MMNKIDNILDYYKGNLAYTYFLLDLAYGSTDKSSFILEKKNILQKKLKWLNIRYVGSDITSNWLLCDMFISD